MKEIIGLPAEEMSLRHSRKMSRILAWAALCIHCVDMTTHYIYGLNKVFLVSIPWLIGYIVMIFLLYTKKEHIARLGTPIIASCAIFFVNEYLNGLAKIQYYYFAASCLSIFILTPKEVKSWRALNAAFPIALFIFQEITNYQFIAGPQVVPETHTYIISKVSIIGTAFVTVGIMYVSMQRLFESHKELSIMSTELAQQNRNSALGTMANGMAHEINNPLAIISSAASLIERTLQEPEINKIKILEHTGRINNTVTRIANIIKSLRNFTSEDNQFGESKSDISLFELVKDVSLLMNETFQSKNIFFENAIPSHLNFQCNRKDIQQAIYNLIQNSIEAIENQSFKWIKIELILTEKQVQLLITDSGLGIDSKIADKIMIPFFTTKEIGKGTGLGLSLSKSLIEKHGGKLYLDTSSHHTCFVIELPKEYLILNSSKKVS